MAMQVSAVPVPAAATSPQYGLIDFQSAAGGSGNSSSAERGLGAPGGPISPPLSHRHESSRGSIAYHDASTTPGSRSSAPDHLLHPGHPQQQHQHQIKVQPLTQSACLDLSLMHHYTRYTYATLADLDSAVPVWRDGFPTEAASHPFLMHGMLSLAALHVALQDGLPMPVPPPPPPALQQQRVQSPPSQSHYQHAQHKIYVDHALQHYTSALTLYRPELINVTRRNCNALFAFSSIAAIISFGVSMTSGHMGLALLQDMHDIFNLLKGIHAVVSAAREWIVEGPLVDLVREFIPRETELPQEVKDTLRILTERIETCGESEDRKNGYHHTLGVLRTWFKNYVYQPDARTRSLVGPFLVPRSYIEALSEKQPMALAILAHYAVFLYDLRAYWWAGDRGVRTVEAVTAILSSEWRDALVWPTKCVGRGEGWAHIARRENSIKMSPPAQKPYDLMPHSR